MNELILTLISLKCTSIIVVKEMDLDLDFYNILHVDE